MTPEQTQKLHSVLSALLNVPASEITDDLSPDVLPAWDSVTHLSLVMAVEETFNVSFTPEETLDMTSVKLIRLMLEEKGL